MSSSNSSMVAGIWARKRIAPGNVIVHVNLCQSGIDNHRKNDWAAGLNLDLCLEGGSFYWVLMYCMYIIGMGWISSNYLE